MDLEKGGKGALRGKLSIIRTFLKIKPFEIRQADGKRSRLYSLVLANIPEMAKYVTLSDAHDKLSDGKLEVIVLPCMAKWRVKSFSFQIDGEGKSVDAHIAVRIECAPAAH
ncbi:hypothetical protein GCM10023063_21310 [Arthrobacter methylotrophus]|uniref:Uncharacterized protein n=2 Tax=Arthrobacter methylotrophus TaxID=121291 RepID=A0ABV5UTP7_9MICC